MIGAVRDDGTFAVLASNGAGFGELGRLEQLGWRRAFWAYVLTGKRQTRMHGHGLQRVLYTGKVPTQLVPAMRRSIEDASVKRERPAPVAPAPAPPSDAQRLAAGIADLEVAVTRSV